MKNKLTLSSLAISLLSFSSFVYAMSPAIGPNEGGGSLMGQIIIEGPAADELYIKISPENFQFSKCFVAHKSDNTSKVQCSIEYYDLTYNKKTKTLALNGLGANELYEKYNDPQSENVKCYKAIYEDGTNEIQCEFHVSKFETPN